MNKSVWTERLPGGYSVRYWTEVAPGVFRKKREWFQDYNLAQKRRAELKLKFLAKQQGAVDPTLQTAGAFDSYLAALTHTHRPATIELKSFALRDLLGQGGSLSSLTHLKVKEWKASLLKEYNINTVALRLRELRAFLNWCKKEQLIQESPFAGIQIPQGKEVGRKLEINELKLILEASDPKFKPYLLMLIYTGARRNEILLTRWQDIDFKDKTWTIPADNSKSKKTRFVPLADAALLALAALPRASDKVFPAYVHNTAHWYLKKALKAAGIEGRVRLHDFRHSFASHWTGDPRILADMVGWNGLQMLKRYSHFGLENARKAANEFGIGAKLDNGAEMGRAASTSEI